MIRVAALLGATLLVAWLGFGGVHHGTRSVLHLGVAAALLAVAAIPDASLTHAGVVLRLAAGSAVLLIPAAIGLVPLPEGVRAVLAPGTVEARPGFGWATSTLSAESTVGELCDLLLPLGVLLVAAAWGATWWRRSGVERALRFAFVGVVVVGALHAATGTTAMFGIVPSSMQPGQRFFAPFVDPNHLGTAVVMLLAPVLAAAVDPRREAWPRAGWAIAAGAGAALLAWIGSSGAVAAAAVVVVGTTWRLGRATPGRLAAGGVAAAIAALVWMAVADPQGAVTFPDRLRTWNRALTTLPSFWFAGSGGGTFGVAIEPLITDFTAWGHAHDDYVEWLLEFGALGVVALPVVAWFWWPRRDGAAPASTSSDPTRPHARPERADLLLVSIAGVCVHALVDFPLQIPALAMCVGALWGLRRGAYESRVPAAPRTVRWAVVPFALAELAACGWEARTAAVDRATQGIRVATEAPAAARTLSWLAPWRPELGLADAMRASRSGDPAAAAAAARGVIARHPNDPSALRLAATILASSGDPAGARAAFDRSIARYPGDWRTWVSRAQASTGGDAADAWQAAFRAGAPAKYLAEAWPTLPLGLVWLEAGATREARYSAILGDFLAEASAGGHRDAETAALAYEQAWLLDPHEPPRAGYARVLLTLGRDDDAARYVAEALKVQPNHPALRQIEVELLERRGEWESAAERWMALVPQRPELLARAMRASEHAHGPDRALGLAEREVKLHPTAILERARLERDRGHPATCAAQLERSGLLDEPKYANWQRAAQNLLQSCQ
ncbi:MAG: Wzy polymerase domain-containing protein [Myxococcota bacterium]